MSENNTISQVDHIAKTPELPNTSDHGRRMSIYWQRNLRKGKILNHGFLFTESKIMVQININEGELVPLLYRTSPYWADTRISYFHSFISYCIVFFYFCSFFLNFRVLKYRF